MLRSNQNHFTQTFGILLSLLILVLNVELISSQYDDRDFQNFRCTVFTLKDENKGNANEGEHGGDSIGNGGEEDKSILGERVYPLREGQREESLKDVFTPGGDVWVVVPEFHKNIFTDARNIAYAIARQNLPGNVLFCDWEKVASVTRLQVMAENLGSASIALSLYFKKLDDLKILLMANAHFIGEGLGAHLWGALGRQLRKRGITVKRITGLDPLGVCFDSDYQSKCADRVFDGLVKSDAQFVDVLFTGREYWGICTPPEADDRMDICSACYFANGGHHQPGCNSNGDSSNIIQACSHIRASKLFAESVLYPDSFNSSGCFTSGATPCELILSNFGFETDTRAQGIFGFSTFDGPPYSTDLICWSEAALDDGRSTFQDCHIGNAYFEL